ncbi:hypothetical protein N7509_009712 [Penicillium cosmopolitanum]|uniref:Nephrocystin 3-like N-terminal domain-containing protein n=1 Tax=Penicillium cosmopolitanum TaxID=1131564 RepID=A0A9X0B3X8_9EURO|nr:uncharacterized protein N7509_009712 [Penicillium cosmopolitanum]KAJ5387171.1 hypothetical protein N7509_009712 [Penicillium cosmopolitanum]
MASQQIQAEAQKHGENIGLRVARSLGKRMSIGGGSKDTTSKEHTDQTGTDQRAIDKGEQIKQGTGQSGIDQQAADQGEQFKQSTGQALVRVVLVSRLSKKEDKSRMKPPKGNFGSAKGLAGKEESPRDVVSGGDTAGAIGGAGSNTEYLSPASAENAGRRMFGSVSVGPPEPNDDIRRGPIWPGPGDQRQTGNTASKGAGSSAKGGLSQEKMQTSQAQSQGQAVGRSPGIAWAQSQSDSGQQNWSQTKESTTKTTDQTFSQTSAKGLGQDQQQDLRKESSVLDPTSDNFRANEAGGISPTQKTMGNKSEGQYGAMKDEAKMGDASKDKDKSSQGHGLLGQAKEKFNQTLGVGSQRKKATSQSKSKQAKGGAAAAGGMAGAGLAAQGNSAGGTFGGGGDSISDEFNIISGISDDVFSDGAAGKTAAKGMGQGLAGKSSTPKKKGDMAKGMTAGKTPQASKQYKQGGKSVAAGQGINKEKGALGQGTSDMSTNPMSQKLSKQGGITMGGMAAMSGSSASDNGAFGGSGGRGAGAGLATGAAGMAGAGALGTGLKQSGSQKGMGQAGMGQAGMGQAGMGQAGMGQAGMGQAGMGQAGMGQAGMGLAGMGQAGMGQAGMGQAGMGQRGIMSEEATSSTTGVSSTRVVQNLSGSSHRVTILQEKVQSVTQKCKTQLGLSAIEITQRGPTVDAFFDAVAAERLRWMPRDGSRLDCSLRWASRLAYAVDALRESIGAFAPGANEAAKMIWGFLILLLESDIDNTDLFESVFGRYGRVAVGIHLLLQYETAYKSSPELQPEAAAVFADLLEMISTTSSSCIEGFKSKESEHVTGHNVDSGFVIYARRYSTHWNTIVESATSKVVRHSSLIYSSPELGSLRQFLGVQDRPLQFILDSRSHTLVDGSFEWFNNTLYDFTIGKSPVLLMTGGPGAGKSAMAQWTVERLQESAEHDSWNVIPYTIRADIPVATLPLRILKGVLHQMLDHSVSDRKTQEAILVQVAHAAQAAMDGAFESEVEESLWKGIRAGLASNIQYMFVVDGLDQIKGGDSDAIAFLEKITAVLDEQNAGSKMIAFTRPLSSKLSTRNIGQFTIQSAQTHTDLSTYVHKMLSSGSHFEESKKSQLQSAVSAIVNRSQGSFSWAEMAIAHAGQQRNPAQSISSIQGLPQTMPELLDFHMKSLDLSQTETRSIMAWLAAAERPLLVEEVEQLMAVDAKGPSFVSRASHVDSAWAAALRPLVMTRDGVVSFAHTCIRDHVIKQVRSVGDKSPLTLKEAHHDLLTRCLAWVQLSVREESEISMDKLSMEERNRLFDKYAVLEYTARYWMSHLLSSPLVTDAGEFQFTASFKKLLPVTVLFARLELTCKESQFTRSSVLELYRLATDIRRLVLGEKSMALLQSLLLSARVSKLAHASHAEEHCYDAWRLSQELLGQSDSITLACAEMMTQSFTESGTMTTQQEDIMKYLILTDTEITGVEFNQRLKYLGMIVTTYKSRSDNHSALLISREYYQQILVKYGSSSRQSSETADFLTGQFSSTGSDEMSRDIARTKYDNVVRTMDVTDERRIKYALYMAQLYESQGEKAQAQGILSNLWTGLNSRDIDSVDMMDKKANVALVYYQFLRRQGRNDEAEVIIRELVADLEITGIHSNEMMQRVQLLRAETQEMHMYSLDRSLSILMWNYYKESNQEYSSDAVELAMSLAEGMANTVSIEDSTSLSGRDRKLMVELLDSITSSPSNLSVSTLILCHNLSSIYVREEDWSEASDCSKAVLQHVWPTVEQAGSHKKLPTELAPPVADLALVLAYCHFRRLHLDQATIVYENAFGSLVASERVPVPSVLAVAKAVVEFYETTFQFTKALTLLHSVSNFLTSRLGETHKHTIENLYLEAALATRLEMNHEAKSTYQRIYNTTLRGSTIAPEGMEAALALIVLYEKELQWDSALDVYRHVWPTLVMHEQMSVYDRMQTEKLIEKTYLGYMNILTTRTKSTEFTERYKVASEYVMTCETVYGPTHQKTLSATLLFAELCESNDSYIDEAISLYKKPLQTSEWVPTSQSAKGLDQMTQPLPITLKHKLAQLFVRKRDSTSEARSLYTEEYQLAKKTQGFFSTTTLSWLRELALAHSRQGTPTSVQQGNALLHTYVTDVLHAGGETDMMADWARKIAAIYLECGFIEGGNNVLRRTASPCPFEESFGRRASSTQIMTEMAREMQTQQAFSKNLSGHDFVPTLIAGDRLARLQMQQNRTRAAKDTNRKLYEYFCATLSASSISDRDIVQQFYGICLREVHSENYTLNILTTTTSLVRDLCNESHFSDASDVTGVLHSFLHLTDGLNSYESILAATQLCLYLSGHNATRCQNTTMFNEMSVKSKLLLQELMTASKSIGIEIVDLPFTQLNDIITLLGEHEMFDELEGILTQLWTSRIVQRLWTPDVVVWIGRRLVETRFCRGSVDSAIQLCRDICYNLRQVWGSCDPVTLEMTKLLSGLFTASNDHQSAATLHEGVLYDLLSDSDAKDHPRAADTATQHMELMRRAQERLGGPHTSTRASAHADLVSQVTERFGVDSEQIKGVGEANGGEKFGVWSRPRRFSIDVEDLEDERQSDTHHNHLRESSGVGLMNGSGHVRRISVQAL